MTLFCHTIMMKIRWMKILSSVKEIWWFRLIAQMGIATSKLRSENCQIKLKPKKIAAKISTVTPSQLLSQVRLHTNRASWCTALYSRARRARCESKFRTSNSTNSSKITDFSTLSLSMSPKSVTTIQKAFSMAQKQTSWRLSISGKYAASTDWRIRRSSIKI